MWTLALCTAFAADPPASDAPSQRTHDWPAVHERATNTSHVAQASGAAAAAVVVGGLALHYSDTDFGGVAEPDRRLTRAAVIVGGGGLVFTSALLNGSALRVREASRNLGSRKPPGPGYAGWAFTAASGAAWITTGAILARDGELPGAELPVAATVCGAGGWVAGTIQLALDKQAQGEIEGGNPVKTPALRIWATPTGLAGQF